MDGTNIRNLDDIIKLLRNSGSPVLANMNDKELLALAKEYDISTPGIWDQLTSTITGRDLNTYTSGLESLFTDVEKLQSFLGSDQAVLNRPAELDRTAIDAASQGAFERDYAKQLGLVDESQQEMLGDIQGTYDTYRKDMLQQQNLGRGQIMNAYQNAFRDQRSRAIEAGASAGLRLANNVNALLSAQNAQRATSLETSNQLANMALQQQNAALSARSQAESNRLGLASKFSETGLKDYQAGQYGTEAGMFDRQMGDYQRNLGNRIQGLGIGSTLGNIGTNLVGQTNFNPLNTSGYNRPGKATVTPVVSNYDTATTRAIPGAMSIGDPANWYKSFGIKR